MTGLVEAAREKMGRRISETWDPNDIDELVRLMREFSDAMSNEKPAGP